MVMHFNAIKPLPRNSFANRADPDQGLLCFVYEI